MFNPVEFLSLLALISVVFPSYIVYILCYPLIRGVAVHKRAYVGIMCKEMHTWRRKFGHKSSN